MLALLFYSIAAAALSNAAWLAYGRAAQVATLKVIKGASTGRKSMSITFANA